MDKDSAKKLIRETFQNPFDKGRFVSFVKNLLNHIEDAPFTYQGNLIPDSYKPYISKYERIGKYHNGENRIDILIVHLNREKSIERARTTQRKFIAGYLQGKYGSSNDKEAAIVAFVSPSEADWRFSLVKMDYRLEEGEDGKVKVKQELTHARRFSFLVGKNENSHTAQSQLEPILSDDENNPSLKQLEEAFSIEKVTKEFFEKYRDLFLKLKESLDEIVKKDEKVKADFEEKGVDTVDFAKKLMGQVLFLYFLQKKGWFGVKSGEKWGSGSKHFLRELFAKKHGDYKNFFNDILEVLFYAALRNDRSHDDHYFSQFRCKIPFLNGGLFDPTNDYDWYGTDILLPDEVFSNDFKTKEDDTGTGVLDVFDRYNFTVKEDEPLEKEVAIDPELLGKAYEKFNAIRPDNYEEFQAALKNGKKGAENKFNKKFGVYYTPREIVHYMCKQSLINYLHAELEGKVSKEAIAFLIIDGENHIEYLKTAKIKKDENPDYKGEYKETKFSNELKEYADKIDDLLSQIMICDPAIGSGAFPVGMMTEIIKARLFFLETEYLPSAYINNHKEKQKRNVYNFKRECIEKSLYGVDIDPGAVEVAKLRLWLSLVVDEEDIRQIKPLPNLDYKIVCGNSLLGVQTDLFNNQLFVELERLKPLYFDETNPTKKQEYKKRIDDLISQITDGHTEFDFEVYFSEVFHEKKGFDVVIANPPYVRQETLGNEFKKLMKKNYPEVANGIADLYVYFFAIAFRLFKSKGTITFITPNKYLKTKYGLQLRNTLRKYQIDKIIDFFELPVFEAANDTAISIVRNEHEVETTKYFPVRSLTNLDLNILTQGNYLTPQKNDTEWIFVDNFQNQILKNFIKTQSL